MVVACSRIRRCQCVRQLDGKTIGWLRVPEAPVTESRWRPVAAFLAAGCIAGLNIVAVRYSNQELPPLWGAGVRFTLAALLFTLIVLAQRRPWPTGPSLRAGVWYGLLGFGLFYAFVYYALVHVQAGLAGIVLALVPLITLLLAAGQGQERLGRASVLGGLLAAAGLAVIYRDQVSGGGPILALLAVLGGVIAAAQGSILLKAAPRADPYATNAVAMAVGAVLLLALSVLRGEPRIVPEQRTTLVALTYLVLVGSLLLFALFLYVLQRWSASRTSYQFVLSPFVAVAAGVVIANERVTWPFVLGGLVVLAGVYIGALRASGPSRP